MSLCTAVDYIACMDKGLLLLGTTGSGMFLGVAMDNASG